MAKIGTDAATEYLLDICRTQTGEIADFILEVLMDHSQERMLSALDRNINMEPSPFLSGQLQDVADNIRSSRVGKKQR